MQSKAYVSPSVTISAPALKGDYKRADIEFHGVDHSGASFEARVFLNDPGANEHTPTTLDTGYAGAFHIFGHGGCYGDAGHCKITGEPRAYDPRPSHPLAPTQKKVIATEALRHASAQGPDMTITIVPVITSLTEKCDLDDVLKFDHINIVTYK